MRRRSLGRADLTVNTYFGPRHSCDSADHAGAQVLNLGWATTPFPRAGYNLTFVGGMWVSAIVYTILAYKYRCIVRAR